MKIGIDAGHMSRGADTGAQNISGSRKEQNYTYKLGRLIENQLTKLGHSVVWCRPPSVNSVGQSLYKRVTKANYTGCQLFVSLHFNALNGRAYGTEIWVSNHASKASYTTAKNVLAEIVEDTGFTNRGVKKANFYVLNKTKMPAILIECCFIDNDNDMRRYNQEIMAKAIVKGLVGEVVEEKPAFINDVILTVTRNTLLKPSTEQSSTISKSKLKAISPGVYKVSWLAKEENHYLVNIHNRNWFIYSEHCRIA